MRPEVTTEIHKARLSADVKNCTYDEKSSIFVHEILFLDEHCTHCLLKIDGGFESKYPTYPRIDHMPEENIWMACRAHAADQRDHFKYCGDGS